ncbi:hypothetical protein [uncultured Clostridium sp.]|uniref:hypothetical protein n=1 Tax=uncultured Clostridium sp. TaxID=59620 RepID=UPI0025CF144C|nr:hypothetical protein [uncultured Clostridium sp.]
MSYQLLQGETTFTIEANYNNDMGESNINKGKKIKEKCMDTVINLVDGSENSTKKEENYGVI